MSIVRHESHRASSSPASRWLDEHGDALYAFAMARVRDPHVAEELVQESLLAALTAAAEFTGRSAERTWLIGILKHKLIDHVRRQLRERPLTPDTGVDRPDELFDRRGHWKVSPGSWGHDPQALVERAEFRDVLARCLRRLPARVAQVFWLREAEEVETAELCERLKITPVNAWAILHRARIGLRRCLSLHWFDGEGPQ
jgi:RNA polymerase sigma-70 factor (ECF subfamily)